MSFENLSLEMEEWDSMSLFAFNDSDSLINDEDCTSNEAWDEQCGESDHEELHPMKKKRIFKKKRRIPRMVRNDIRKLFSTMFTNVVNINEFNLLSGFFDTYCHKNARFVLEAPTSYSAEHPHSPRFIDVSGADLTSQFLFNRLQSFPDIAMTLGESRVLFSNITRECVVISKFRMKGTKIHQVPPSSMIYTPDNGEKLERNQEETVYDAYHRAYGENNTDDLSIVNSCTNNTFCCQLNESVPNGTFLVNYESQLGHKGRLIGYSVERYAEILNNAPLLKNPIDIQLDGTMTMYLDADNRMSKVVFFTDIMEFPKHIDSML